MEVTVFIALIAGIVSFISPCVLPLVPAYIGYMGGRLTHTVAVTTGGQTVSSGFSNRLNTVAHGLFFVAGFTFVFVVLGLFSTAFISVIGGSNISTVTNIIGRIGGLLIIFFGLHFMGVMPALFARFRAKESLTNNIFTSIVFALVGIALLVWGFTGTLAIWDVSIWEATVWAPVLALIAVAIFLVWLFLDGAFTSPGTFWNRTINRLQTSFYTDTRRQMTQTQPDDRGFASSAIMGVIFSAGWTPCIGPVYGSVLTMAANGGDVGQAGLLLTAYSLGLGIPFLLTALMLDSAQSLLRRLQRQMHRIELVSGAFLVLIGLLVASGQLQSLSQQFSNQFADFSVTMEESVLGFLTGSSDNAVENPTNGEAAESTPEAAETSQNVEPLNIPQSNTGLDLTNLAETTNKPSIGLAVGSFAPQFETVSDSGQPVRLADFRGQVVLLNFWATWCGPCRVEMPEFEAIYNERKNDGFTVLAVNNSETLADVQEFRDEMNLSFPMLMDETAQVQALYNVISYPSTYIIDREGKIIQRNYGALTVEQIHDMIDGALAS
ncbi:MAG: redoxin domain-containing protein [Anaerolineae bacterium]|nr:redoxin domain-containing protein [Anaerolineae bacterium]